MAVEKEVVIVGGGPVGLSLALCLNHWKVKCVILNEAETTRVFPKGNGENSWTMEIMRHLGLSDGVRELFPGDHSFDQAYFTRFNAWELYRSHSPGWNQRKQQRAEMPVDDQYPEPMFHTNQMYFERFLLEKAREAEHVEVRFGWTAIGFQQDKNGIEITAKETKGSRQETFRAAYLADCGGGHSFIRKGLDIHYTGDVQSADEAHWAGDMWNVWVRIPEFYEKCAKDRQAWFYWAVNEDPDTRSCLIELNGTDEFMLMVKPNSSGEVDINATKRWLVESIGEDIEVEIIDFASWKAGAALSVERYRTGRIFQLGDAAHLFTPVGSFGMNTGVADAHNLAWKLAALTQDWGGPLLLDSYELERRSIGFRNTGAARLYSSRWHDIEKQYLDHLEEDSKAGEEARKKIPEASYIKYNHFNKSPEVDATGIQLGARYDHSPIILHDTPAPIDKFPETYNVYHPSGAPGGRAPHIWMEAGQARVNGRGASLYDRIDPVGFTLLQIVQGKDADTSKLEQALKTRKVPFTLLKLNVPEALELYGKPLVLLRPDKYICWRGDELPENCDGLVAHVCGFETQGNRLYKPYEL